MGDRANHVGCVVRGCDMMIEARDLEQAEETHAMLVTDGHPLTVAVSLTVEQVEWLLDLTHTTAKVAADGPDAEHAQPVADELNRVWTVG